MNIKIADFEGIVGSDVLDWDEVELENLHPSDGRVPHVPFGFNNAEWKKLKELRSENTELRSFSSSSEDWEKCMGSEGYLVIEGDTILANIVTRMN